jgi:hypothetical protein
MCNDCFVSEVNTFHGVDGWKDFEQTLKRKLDQGTMKKLTLDDATESVYVHQCGTCKENWVLQLPVNGTGGSFLTLTSVLKKMAVPRWRRTLTIVVLVLVIIVVIMEMLSA